MTTKETTGENKRIMRRSLGKNPGRNLAIVMAFMLCIMTITVPNPSYADEYAIDAAGYTYENPQDIIIKGPGATYKTTAANISIYGACDFEYPLYMNGTEINKTQNGFFAEYVPLNVGDNTFVFTNNGKEKSVVITRTATSGGGGSNSGGSNSGGSGSGTPAITAVSGKYLTMTSANASRMATPGGDDKALLMPIAKDTVAQITGSTGSLYRLYDGTFVYKSNAKVTDGYLARANASGAQFVASTGNRASELQLQISQNSLYDFKIYDKWAVLTVYNTTNTAQMPAVTSNKLIKSISVTDNGASTGNSVYSIELKDNAQLNGYYVEFENGLMKVGLRERPVVTGDDLSGIVIHIDPGHGGTDTGALGAPSTAGPTEKQINLNISLVAKQYLESRGATVIMTRNDDSSVGLATRAATIAAEKPDFCISIHCNSTEYTVNYNKVRGFQTYYSFAVDAASYINTQVADSLDIDSTKARYKNLAMTRMTAYPAVLIESEFMSNPQAYEWLTQRDTQVSFGEGVGKAVEGYIKAYAAPKDVTVTINGNNLEMDQPPVIKDSRTLVPLRAIFEALGATVQWNNDTRTVTADKENIGISLPIDSTCMNVTKDGTTRTVTLDVPAQLVNDRTMVPVRAVSEALDAKVDWDNDSRTVVIEY